MKNQLLLLEDVDNVGRGGELVSVRPGFARNFLIPQKKAVLADSRTIRLQAKLQEERAIKAAEDKKHAEVLGSRISALVLSDEVKVDSEGHMYGSVSAQDIVHLLEKQGISIEKKNIVLAHAIKVLGSHTITVKLKEGVTSSFVLNIEAQGQAKDPNAQP